MRYNVGRLDRNVRLAAGAAALGIGAWRMIQGRRDWLTWTLTTMGFAKVVEATMRWDPMFAATDFSTRGLSRRVDRTLRGAVPEILRTGV